MTGGLRPAGRPDAVARGRPATPTPLRRLTRSRSFARFQAPLAFLSICTGILLAANLRARADQVASTGETVFLDDFSGTAFDRTKWNVIITGRTVNNEQQAYVDSDETIAVVHGADAEGAADGALRIRPRFHQGFKTPEGRTFDFTSGRLESQGKVEFTYGVVSARIKLTAGAGLWPAFWTLGNGRWPDSGEMDVMENVGDATWTSVALHGPGYSGNTPLVKRRTFPAAANITGWHVYSMHWTPDGFVFNVDDDEFYRVSRAAVEQYGRWAYDNPKYLIVNFALGGQYPQSVNHATGPYPGLPQDTVDLIKAGEARMLVDWVKVTRN
jgi:beta-glucanase (GH16 family)